MPRSHAQVQPKTSSHREYFPVEAAPLIKRVRMVQVAVLNQPQVLKPSVLHAASVPQARSITIPTSSTRKASNPGMGTSTMPRTQGIGPEATIHRISYSLIPGPLLLDPPICHHQQRQEQEGSMFLP